MNALTEFINFVAPRLTEKHLGSQHDQQSHAGGVSFDGEGSYAERLESSRQFGLKASSNLKGASVDQKAALRKYQEPTFKGINNGLRKGKVPKSAEKTVKHLDQVFKDKKNAWPEDSTVYRGLGFLDVDHLLKAKPGSIIQEKGYTSTSFVPERAKQYGSAKVKIRVPKGAKAIYPDAANEKGRSFDSEVLLNRDSRFRVVSVKPGPKAHMPGDGAEVELELIVE